MSDSQSSTCALASFRSTCVAGARRIRRSPRVDGFGGFDVGTWTSYPLIFRPKPPGILENDEVSRLAADRAQPCTNLPRIDLPAKNVAVGPLVAVKAALRRPARSVAWGRGCIARIGLPCSGAGCHIQPQKGQA